MTDTIVTIEPQPPAVQKRKPEGRKKPNGASAAISTLPVVIEFAAMTTIEKVMMAVGAAVNTWLATSALDCPVATIWSQCRTGDVHLLIAHDGHKVYAVSFWRLEQWNAGTVFRCIAHGADPEWSNDWVPGFIELARARAQACCAIALVWEAMAANRIAPDKAVRARESLVIDLQG